MAELQIKRTFGEEDMPQFIQIIVISTKVINHTTDRLQQRTEHDAPAHCMAQVNPMNRRCSSPIWWSGLDHLVPPSL